MKKTTLPARTSWKKDKTGRSGTSLWGWKKECNRPVVSFPPRGPSETNWCFRLGQTADRGMAVEEEKTTENTHRRMQKAHTSMRAHRQSARAWNERTGSPLWCKDSPRSHTNRGLDVSPLAAGSRRSCDDGDGERGVSTVTVTQSYIQQQKPQRKEGEDEGEEEEKKRRERRRFREAASLLLQEQRFQRCSSRAARSSEFRQKYLQFLIFPRMQFTAFFPSQYINVSICLSGFPLATLIT